MLAARRILARVKFRMSEIEVLDDTLGVPATNNGYRSWLSPMQWFTWRPTSAQLLAEAERKILQGLKEKVSSKFISVHEGTHYLRTISLNENNKNLPIVMLHGMGSGVALWALNLDHLAKNRPVHAIDLLGFGRSSRPHFSRDANQAEELFMTSIEEWRQKMNLDSFILMGHSFGGYLASAYAIKHPEYIKHLVLVDPWGFPEKTGNRASPVPTWIKVVGTMLHPFNPFAGLRLVGPWGPRLIRRLRPDLGVKYNALNEDDAVFNYIYHCNAQDPSGESAFKSMSVPLAWAKYPMCSRVTQMDADVPITMIYGSRSWMDRAVAYQVKYLREESYVDVQVVRGAGHHVYADKPDVFHKIMDSVFEKVAEDVSQCQSNDDTYLGEEDAGILQDTGFNQSTEDLQDALGVDF